MTEFDLSELEKMVYPGRAEVAFMTPEGNPGVAHIITGRSPPSQARTLEKDEANGVIYTRPTNEEELKQGNPLLLLYPAIRHNNGVLMATNGAQTKVLMRGVNQHNLSDASIGYHFGSALEDEFQHPFLEYDVLSKQDIDITSYEPDKLHTPRVNIYHAFGEVGALIVRCKENLESETCVWSRKLCNGTGIFLPTYAGDNSEPIQPFTKMTLPELKIGSESADEIAMRIYEATAHGGKPGENFGVAVGVMILHQDDRTADLAVYNRHREAQQ